MPAVISVHQQAYALQKPNMLNVQNLTKLMQIGNFWIWPTWRVDADHKLLQDELVIYKDTRGVSSGSHCCKCSQQRKDYLERDKKIFLSESITCLINGISMMSTEIQKR